MAITRDTAERSFSDVELFLGLERLSDTEWKKIVWDLEDVVNDLDYGKCEGILPVRVDGIDNPLCYIKADVDMPNPYDEIRLFKAELNLYMEDSDQNPTFSHWIGRYTLSQHPSLFWVDDHGGFARIKALVNTRLHELEQ